MDVKQCRCNKHSQVAVPGGLAGLDLDGRGTSARRGFMRLLRPPADTPQPVGSTTRTGPGGVVLRGRSWLLCESAIVG
jgi:hypothetical protein